jgi:hypothetical protein
VSVGRPLVNAFNARAALLRLVKGGYVVDRATDDLVHYRIMRRGDDALSEQA